VTHIWLTRPDRLSGVLPRLLSRAAMYARRLRVWLAQFRWWAILALIAGVCCVVIAFTTSRLVQVIAVGALSITLAILATREEAP
jgi:hypothetical protein